MATSTTNYSFTLPEVGGDTDQWGTQLNANWTLADTTLKTIADSVGDDVTLVGNDYLSISGQAITVGSVDLTTDVTGTLPVGSGGTGLAALGSANQVLGVNSGGTALEFQTLSTGGSVTSVAVTGSDGIEIDSGSPITSSGTIALGINSTSLSTHLGLGSLATQSTITESQISDLGSYITASSTDTLTNKSGDISQWTNDSGYLTAETNDLTNVSGTLAIANGGTGSSTAATARVALLPALATNGSKLVAVNSGATDIEYIATSTLSITESQISDLQSYLTAEVNDLSAAVSWANVPDANITQSSVTQHQAALSITESQITDFGSYQTSDAGLTSIAGLTTAADKMIYTTAADTYAVTTLTTAGRALLDDADAAAQRTTLGLGSAATSNTSAFESAGSVSTHAALTEVHGISAFGATLVDDADAAAARTTLGVDVSGTDNSTPVSLVTTSHDYLSLSSQTITLGPIVLTTDVSGTLPAASGGTGVTALSSLDAADLGSNNGVSNATDGYVLTADGTGGVAWEAATGGISDIVSDTTPQLGGNLDVNGSSIVSVSAGNIAITPDTTGKIILDGLSWPTADGSADQVLKTDGSGNLSFVDQSGGAGSGSAYIEHSSTVSDSLAISSGTNRMYVGRTDFSSGGVTMAGTLVVAGGYANFTSASALVITGTLNVI
jgi:hypothetical protein